MNLRRALHEQAIQHGLDAKALARLYTLARLTTEPQQLVSAWPQACAIAGGTFVGMAAIMWVAANWVFFGRYGRLLLAELFVLLPLALILWRPQWRLPMALTALLGIGALFACMGQTYQTGADPWQLFALWAVLALPLCLGIRHEAVWVPWLIVTMTALALAQQQALPAWMHYQREDFLSTQLCIWAVLIALVAVLRLPVGKKLGSGKWSFSLALISAISLITIPAFENLVSSEVDLYWPGLVIVGTAAAVFSIHKHFDVLGLCLSLLAVNVLLDTAVCIFFFGGNGLLDWYAVLFFILFVCVGILSLSMHWLRLTLKREGVLR